ncbi:MAG: ThuA domain-containing protein [Cyclobacteriaceae bacterium]|nr:ThuA domain-containing protein [Cyclobacteriaceae bacterium]
MSHRKLRYFPLRAFILIFILTAGCNPPKRFSDKIEVLFLGHDSKHHDSEQYLPILASHVAKKGINFTYTSSPESFNAKNLARFDAVMVYANHDSISSEQEKALLDFVAGGKGFLPIHCASYCFRNSDEYIKLVGAQFKSHGLDSFSTAILDVAHPVTAGFQGFETWDETYVHEKHNADRTVLMERTEGDHTEPWTWVRQHGKGKVFYTAYGHDDKTWENPGFLDLLERAIVWSVADDVKERWSKLTFEALQYSEAKIPNYEKRNPPPKLQAPLSAASSQKFIQVPPGFKLELFAAEPDIINPVSMAWDEKGRLWVIETVDYPNSVRQEDGIGDDRIKICEDTDGDGKADKFTLFAENLNIPTSLVFANDGVIVAQAPHFLFMKDTDGDGKADIREELITGWGTFDTHAGPSNLRYGFDNQIWGTVGYSGFEGTVGGQEFDYMQALYRFKPDAGSMEVMGSTTNNTWGLGFSEDFNVFASTANNTHSVFMGIPKRYFDQVTGIRDNTTAKIDGHYAFHPITRNIRQVDVFGGFTAAAGHSFYTARNFPERYWNKVAFVSEPTGHLLHEAIIERDGAGFKEKDGWNILASADEWVSPVQAEVGPDGALWVLDWYNFIIQHNPTPTGFDNGSGNAHVNPLRDRKHGRIYRMTHMDHPTGEVLSLSKDDPQGLVRALSNDNLFWRLTAQRLLVERGEHDILPQVLAMIKDQGQDATGLNAAAIHGLWLLHGLNALEENQDVVAGALAHPTTGVRKAALQVLPPSDWARKNILANKLMEDPDLNVRLHAFLAIADMSPADDLGKLLYQYSQDTDNLEDPWLSRAIYCGAVVHKNGFLNAFKAENPGTVSLAHEYQNSYDDSTWETTALPAMWSGDLENFRGTVWYRKTIDLPNGPGRGNVVLHLPPVDDADEVWVNGARVGTTSRRWNDPRKYIINPSLLKAGGNLIVIRVENTWGQAGIKGEAEELFMQTGNEKVALAGEWKYRIGTSYSGLMSPFDKENPIDLVLARNYSGQTEEQEGTPQAFSMDEDVQVIQLTVVKNEMKYSLEAFEVKAGSKVKIVLENTDFMQHNLLVLAEGALNKVGAEADKLAMANDGAARNYVPVMAEVLYSTPLVSPGEKAVLEFTAPEKEGDYPYVCTFPGHWRLMNGVMKVSDQ